MSGGPLAPRDGSSLRWGGPPLAGYRDRVEAAVFDWVGPALAVWLVPLALTGTSRGLAVVVQVLLLVGGLSWVAWNAVVQGRTGMSYGKRRVGIRLVDRGSLAVVGPRRSLLRWLARLADLLPCFVGLLLPIVDPASQTLADKLAGTVVLDGPTPAPIVR